MIAVAVPVSAADPQVADRHERHRITIYSCRV
jgi:hypothetical protein